MKNFINKSVIFAKKAGKVALLTGITAAVIGFVAYSGHHFGAYDMTPVFDMLNFKQDEFALGAGTITAISIFSRLALTAFDTRKAFDQEVSTYNTDRLIKSNNKSDVVNLETQKLFHCI